MIRRRLPAFVALLVAAAVLSPVGVNAGENFTESEGCGPAGFRGPLAERSGFLPLDHEVYGPWADCFGRNGYAIDDQLVSWRPYRSSRTVRVHELALPAFQLVNENLAAEDAKGNYYRVTVAYGHAFRAVTGSSQRFSFHAIGTAVDINPAQNPYNNDDPPVLVTDMPDWYVKAWTDAGFCWGGDWQSIKDAMHFSWRGPAATPGYPASPAPQPAVTSVDLFRTSGFTGDTDFDSDDWHFDVVDRSRDGAPDIYAWRWQGDGLIRLEIASGFRDFRDVGIRANISVSGGPSTHGVTFADYDGDSRADLWVADWASGVVKVYGDTVSEADRFTEVIAEHTMAVTGGSVLLAGDYNRDRYIEAYVVDANGRLRVLDGRDGFQTVLVDVETGARPQWNRFDLGDYDANGFIDLYAISAVGQQVYVANGYGSGYWTGPYWSSYVPQSGDTQVADYDGDGRPDIYHFGDDRITVYLGGNRQAGVDLQAWFDNPTLTPWDAGPECLNNNRCDRIGYVTSTLEFNLRDNLSWEGGNYHEFFFGVPGDIPLTGDWDGNRVSTPGMFRPSNGFVYLANTNATQVADTEYFFGMGGDIPVAGDWDGDGRDTLSIYRPSNGRFYVSNELQTQFADFEVDFSLAGTVRPFSGDFNGDGSDDLGLYRPSDGYVAMRFMGSSGGPDAAFHVGSEADNVLAGDWTGDGVSTVAWHDEAEGRWYFRLSNTQGAADHILRAGPRDAQITPLAGGWIVKTR